MEKHVSNLSTSIETLFIDDAGADFAVQVISDDFKGKVRVLATFRGSGLYPFTEHSAASSPDLFCPFK
jgi:hypothetical protein